MNFRLFFLNKELSTRRVTFFLCFYFSAKPEDFEFIQIIGKGNFGLVFLVKHLPDNKKYAVKMLDKNVIFKKGEEKHVMNERNILIKNHNHPFVTSLYYSFETQEKLFLAMEYIPGGEVRNNFKYYYLKASNFFYLFFLF